ncbi:hypothetical protein [Nocardioides sp. SYSU DS0663]|uniref:hypothetical protein n=1 Tax=Nocardioides sp. SYSU DS0663 TaxID=3416445 RepID=UPI003F4BBD6C
MADHRHKRDTNARRKPRAVVVAGPIAVLATAAAVTFGVAATPSAGPDVVASAGAAETSATPESSFSVERPQRVSRAASRLEPVPTKAERMLAPAAVRRAVRNADTRLWATTALDLWSAPGEKAKRLGLLDEGKRVLVTGRSLFDREEVVVGGKARWVTEGYLVAEKPVVEEEQETAAARTAAPQVGGTCTNGTSVSPGVSPNIVKVHNAVCSAFPQITSYGDFRGDGEHAQGIALDVMVSGELGWQIAEFLRANYAELGISYLIYAQKIWSVERAGEGWRSMEDRGSVTANHYDHVHVTTY